MAAAVGDGRGNLYIAGATTSLDFPAKAAAQATAGGSMLVRLSLSNGTATRLFPANLPNISFVAAAPGSPGILYAASGSEIWQSHDGGTTWTRVSAVSPGANTSAVAVDPTNSNIAYVATYNAGVYKSLDGGVTWTPIDNGLVGNPNGIQAQGIWIDPSTPSVVVAAVGSALYRSADGGATWIATSAAAPTAVVFDASTAGTVYIGSGNTVLRSTDHGATYTALGPLPQQLFVLALAVDPHHPAVLYAGTTSGLYQSTDGGATWNLKLAGATSALVADPNSSALYANAPAYGIVKTTDGFTTTSPIGPNEPSVKQLVVSGSELLEISAQTTDAFITKLDNNGNVVYSTYFGGSGNDAAVALAVGADGSVYVTGSTNSSDLTVTPGAYLSKFQSAGGASATFVLKLNPDGSLGWATYFIAPTVQAIAVDAAGNPYIGGYSAGGLTTTPGAYVTDFKQSVTSNGFFSVIGPTSGFVTKFNATGTGLIYSTYVPTDNQKNAVENIRAIVVDASGNAWLATPPNSGVVPAGPTASVVELNPAGSAVLASAVQPLLDAVAALALDSVGNVYVAGSYSHSAAFPATPGAFQSSAQPVIPALPYGPTSVEPDAFVAKWDKTLSHLLAATLIGGEQPDGANSIAVDASGTVIVAGTTSSRAFPTHAPFQGLFSTGSGFVAGFDSNLTSLLFSTFAGDSRPFSARAAFPDGNGNLLLVGSTFTPGASTGALPSGGIVVANKIALPAAPKVRLDSVQNYASHYAAPLAPGEAILAVGTGFGSAAQIVLNGSPLPTISATATSVVAVMPDAASTSGVHTLQVSNNGTLSNSVYMPAAPSSPAIYSVDGSGVGQGYIFNADGTLNSPSNPAATGSAITIFINGAGQYQVVNGYAVVAQPLAVFIDGFYCNGIVAVADPVNGLPGNVFQLSVYVPDPAVLAQNNPDLKNFQFPAQSGIQIVMGPTDSLHFGNSLLGSQSGIFINIK